MKPETTKTDIRQIAVIVKKIMENDKLAREDDFYLYGKVLALFGVSTRCHLNTIFKYIRAKKIPPFETVSRARRRAQELYEDLRAPDYVVEARMERASKFVGFVKDKSI